MDWRREDTGYAAATVAVVAFVGYLLAANFGLVPSPLAPLLDGAPPAAAAVAAPTDVRITTELPEPPPAPAVDRPSATLPPATAGITDTAEPAVSTTTQDGTTFGVTDPAIVEGTADDAGSGIDEVLVAFLTSSGTQVVPADLACSGSGRRTCTWTAEVPAVVASYTVTAQAVDATGNRAKARPIDITVVNTGGAVQQVGETVGRVPSALVGAVDGLLKGLGGVLGG